MLLIDSHAHLDMQRFDSDRAHVIQRATSVGVRKIITIGIDVQSSMNAVALSKDYLCVFATIGIHPHNADRADVQDLKELHLLAKREKVVAIGEIGLDFFRNLSSRKNQIEIFKRQLDMAVSLNLPVVIHDREAHEEVLKVLSSSSVSGPRGVIHCFSGSYDLAKAFMSLGYFISIPGTATLENASQTQDVATRAPLNRMLLETDAPFLTPLPHKGKRNEPSFIVHTAQKVAKLRGIPVQELALQTSINTCQLFDLPFPTQ